MGNMSSHIAQITGLSLLLAGIGPAVGQDAMQGDRGLTFGITSTLRTNDNIDLRAASPGTVTLWDNRLSFGAFSETQASRISLDLGATIRSTNAPGQPNSTRIDDPSARFAYRLESPGALFEIDAVYNQVSLSFADPLRLISDNPDGGTDDRDLAASDGTRRTYGATLRLEGGRVNPVGYGLSASYNRTEYNTTRPGGLYDSQTRTVNGFVRLQVSPVIESRISAFWEEYDSDDIEQRSRRTIGTSLNVSYDINPVTVAIFDLGYRKTDETTLSSGATSTDGITGSFVLSRDIPTGNVSAELSRRLSPNGYRNSFELSGTFERPSGEVAATLGLTKGNTGDLQWIGRLATRYDLPRGSVSAELDRSVRTTTEGVESISNRASLSYQMEVTPRSSFSFGLDYVEINEVRSPQSSALTGLNASYTHTLTQDWELEAGYEYRKQTETALLPRDSNAFYLTVRRDFTTH